MSGCEVPRCGQCARWWHMGEDRYLDSVGVCGDEMVEDLGVECPPQLAVAWARTHQVGYGRRAARPAHRAGRGAGAGGPRGRAEMPTGRRVGRHPRQALRGLHRLPLRLEGRGPAGWAPDGDALEGAVEDRGGRGVPALSGVRGGGGA